MHLTQNGHVDNGRVISKGRCPNCDSDRYFQTVATEQCPACGLRFDYWGSARGNKVYQEMEERHAAAEQRAEMNRRRDEDQHLRDYGHWPEYSNGGSQCLNCRSHDDEEDDY